MNALEQLAHWAATVSPEHTATAYEWATQSLIDTMGCMIAGSEYETPQTAFTVVSQWGVGSSSVVGQAKKLPALSAALVNSSSANALDFNSWAPTTAAFTPSTILSALLAIAEEQHYDGKAVLDALIVGLEVAMRIGEAVNLGHYHGGWHTSATMDTIGAAAGCARLLGLDEKQMAYAMSISISRAAGFKSQFGTMTKVLHCGLAAQTAVMAAQFAAGGFDAGMDTLDGHWSFLTLMGGENPAGFAKPLAKLGKILAIDEFGIVFKPFPTCAYTHRALDGILTLRKKHNLTLNDVDSVFVRIPAHNAAILIYPEPKTESEARFSMPYCMATALYTGNLTANDFLEDALWRPSVRNFLSRVILETHPVKENSSDLDAQEPALVTIQLHNGERLTARVDLAKGLPTRPFSQADLTGKFHTLADPVCGSAKSQEILALLYNFTDEGSIPALMQRLRSEK